MSTLTKFELKKIAGNKRTAFLLIGMVLVNLIAFYITDFAYARAFVPDEKTHSLKILTGFAAVRYDREVDDEYAGLLTDEKAREMDSDLSALQRSLEGYSEDDAACVMNSYANRQAILENLKNPDGSLRPVSQGYPHPLRLGYSAGWKGMVGSFSGVVALILCAVLIVCISPVFSQEYDWKTDSVLCCTRYGKSRLISAKIRASFLFLSAVFAAFAAINFCLYGAAYGLDGADCSIQSSVAYAGSGYSMTFLQLWLYSLIMGLVGLFCLAAVVLCISAASRGSMTSAICSMAAVLAPLLFDFSDSYPALQKFLELFPVYLMHASGVFKRVQTYTGIVQPTVMTAVAFCCMLLFLGIMSRVFQKHQVA